MMKFLNYVKWAIIAVLVVIVALWLSYFLDSLNKSERHFFLQSNYALNFLKWVNASTNGTLIIRTRLFDDNFYLEDFPGLSVFMEILFVILLVVSARIQKQRPKQYILKLCISILCFVLLFIFLNATLKLFVPG